MARGKQNGRLVPENPAFGTESERQIWTVLADSLEEGEVLFHGLRFTDAKEGDVEIDLLLLSPTRGAAVIEVKGGVVEFRDGEWTLATNGGARRRIRPVDQARRAKHALRRYLDRSPEWPHGLLRSQWFIALPGTEVTGDMGPEAPRDRLIGRSDVSRAREMVNDGLTKAPREPAVPEEGWVTVAQELILNAPEASLSRDRFDQAHAAGGHSAGAAVALVGLAIAVVVAGVLAYVALGPWGLALAALLAAIGLLTSYRFMHRRSGVPIAVALTVTLASLAAGGAGGWMILQREGPAADALSRLSPQARATVVDAGIDAGGLVCHDAYSPCVLDLPWDRNCDDIGFRVAVIGSDDPYGLDRDGDGSGCTSYPESETGEAVATE